MFVFLLLSIWANFDLKDQLRSLQLQQDMNRFKIKTCEINRDVAMNAVAFCTLFIEHSNEETINKHQEKLDKPVEHL